MLVVLTLNFFLFEPKFVLVLRLTRLSSSRPRDDSVAFYTEHQIQSSCLCEDYNILLLFKQIFYTLETYRVHLTLSLTLTQAKKYKV